MKLFKREIPLKDIFIKGRTTFGLLLKVYAIFKKPLTIVSHYLSGTSPSNRLVELKSGLRIHFSSHPHDLITTLVIFGRADYGKIEPNAIVVDIGANIGIFSL